MIIDNKIVYVYDIEVFPNVFHTVIKNTESKEYAYLEISERRNDLTKIFAFFSKNLERKLICGYNCIHYDNPIINFLVGNYFAFQYLSTSQICHAVYELSNTIITSQNQMVWMKWKYANKFRTLDLLTMLFSKALRCGLKEMEVTMQFHNVQEYEGDFSSDLPISEIDKMIAYNKNDVDATEELLYRCEKDIQLRLDIEKEFNIDVLSKDGMTIGNEILKLKYLEQTGKEWKDIKDLRSPCPFINLKEVILPFIKFETPELQSFLNEFKEQIVSPGRDGYNKKFMLGGLVYSVGVGGIHSINKPEEIIPTEDEVLLDSDVASLYPSLLIQYKFIPRHLGEEFLTTYAQIREDRLYAKKHKQKVKNETYKLALNGATGNFQNEYSWMYDPFAVMQIRINGQLLLLMLAERLMKAGGRIKQINTDGILYLFSKSKLDVLDSILKEWEQLTGLILETDEFEKFYQSAVNDYVGALKGYSETKDPKLLKKKGFFIDEVVMGKGMSPKIIPKAAIKYLIDGVPIAETIKSSRNLNDFITYQKVDKKFSVEYNGEFINRINRYYCSNKGYYLYKCKLRTEETFEDWVRFHTLDGDVMECSSLEFNMIYKNNYNKTIPILNFIKKVDKIIKYGYINLLKDSAVKVVNDFKEIQEFPTDINYEYYIRETNKIISPFTYKQITLFD
jgi:hypothetical protein